MKTLAVFWGLFLATVAHATFDVDSIPCRDVVERESDLVIAAMFGNGAGESCAPFAFTGRQRATAADLLQVRRSPAAVCNTLRRAASTAGHTFGSAVQTRYLTDPGIVGDLYRRTLRCTFSNLIPENEMKLGSVRPREDRPLLLDPVFDQVEFALRNNMAIALGPLNWHRQQPTWLQRYANQPEALQRISQDFIDGALTPFNGLDVLYVQTVNEAFEDWGGRRDSVWSGMGVDRLEHTFVVQNAVAPDMPVLYNDYGAEEVNRKSDAIYAALRGLRDNGAPLQAIGFQCHLGGQRPLNEDSVRQNFRRFRELGLDIFITELDRAICEPPTEAAYGRQAAELHTIVRLCIEEPACKALTVWGVSDGQSWIPGEFPNCGAALPLDEFYRRKPGYEAIIDAYRPYDHDGILWAE